MGVNSAPILSFDALDSTNAEARRRAEAGELGPLWITAARQVAGRGRRGRAWETGAGNLAATLLTTTHRAPAEAANLSFVAALAVADLAASVVPDALVKLKWPNDVLVDGRKVSGILIESGRVGGGALWLAVGIGVNLRTPPEASERPATALADHLRPELSAPPEALVALQTLAAAFARHAAAWETQGFAPVRRAWLGRAYGLGRPCAARLERETVEGIAEDLDATGALIVRLADGSRRAITAGDVFMSET